MPRPRRHFLRIAINATGGVLLYSLDGQPFRLAAQSTRPPAKSRTRILRIPLRFFTESEAAAIAAAAARIFPSDDSGPGATEANVIVYIDRQLAGPYGRGRFRYSQPPFEPGLPEQGDQAKDTPRDTYRTGLALLGPDFDSLPPERQDEKLRALESGAASQRFFRLLRSHVIEGMFCDPMHGGNQDLIGWQLIGFPGPYMSWSADFLKHQGRRFRPKPRSLAQVVGHPVKPWNGEPE